MIYHVSPKGRDTAAGTARAPFRTIGRAAQVAAAGDTVRVHEGVYREWVDPQNGGTGENARIVYEAAAGEHAVIKGSEIVTDWERVEGSVYKKVIPNALFGDYNPFADPLDGDWLRAPLDPPVHAGDVYLDGRSMYEAPTIEDLFAAPVRTQGCVRLSFEMIRSPEETVYRWYAEVDAQNTTIWGNFQEKDPNAATVEINVRKCCFFPRKTGLNYITVRGFEIAHAATPWNPPTAEQIGMVGPHWAKGWIIENNHLHDAKTCAVSLGKEAATGENFSTRFGRKSGHRYQAEAVFAALRLGWDKTRVGSHTVRNNLIHDCGQTGIVGHMGAAFSRIEHNRIYNVAIKHEFWGHEIAGIKLHAAVDAVIENNMIYNCTLGVWLDWQAQGTRLSRNVFHHNDRDLMVEVTHGPLTVDNNLFLSPRALDDAAQGTALVHNVIAGVVKAYPVMDRATPYHFPHSTEVMGYAPVYGGDNRIYNNLFLGVTPDDEEKKIYLNFCQAYDKFSTPEEYPARLDEVTPVRHAHTRYARAKQPVWIGGNAYAGHARPFRAEEAPATTQQATADITQKDGVWTLSLRLPAALAAATCRAVDALQLGAPRITEEPFENPDGTPVDFSRDFAGKARGKKTVPGAFAALMAGENVFPVWKD